MSLFALLLAVMAPAKPAPADPLAPLDAVASPLFKAERVVRRGETITLRVRQGALTVSTPARALNDAAAGERVRLVVTATRRTVEAVAEAPGAARLTDFSGAERIDGGEALSTNGVLHDAVLGIIRP